MKILLRNFNGEQYVWKTAKYNRNKFWVSGTEIRMDNIVSIINDNRKKYVQCSSCGQVFRKGDPRFEVHKANAAKPETCFDCPHLVVDGLCNKKRKYTVNENGEYVESLERTVLLRCSKVSSWSYQDINSSSAISRCKKRNCCDAEAFEITDFFTQHPGAFDDIITVDQLYDKGYEITLNHNSDSDPEIEWGDAYTIYVIINRLGIVDHFCIWHDGDNYDIHYSKRYNELYVGTKNDYEVWYPFYMNDETREEIKTKIANIYN